MDQGQERGEHHADTRSETALEEVDGEGGAEGEPPLERRGYVHRAGVTPRGAARPSGPRAPEWLG
jgi:hypothetical protein